MRAKYGQRDDPKAHGMKVDIPIVLGGNHGHSDDGDAHDQNRHGEETDEDELHLQSDPPVPEQGDRN
jgi:hypothetical protein